MARTKTKKKGNARQKALDVHKKVASKIIENLEKGVRPWNKPWKGGQSSGMFGFTDLPVSASTGKSYRGSNVWYLSIVRDENNYVDNQWGTYNIWKKKGEQHAKSIGSDEYFGVQKGAKSHPVVYWKKSRWIEEDEVTGEERVRHSFHPKYFLVFNRAETGLPPIEKPKMTKKEEKKKKEMAIIDAERIFDKMVEDLEIDFRESKQGRAYYSPSQDYIHLPNRDLFKTAEGRVGTAFHEAVHWTGHASRLDRDLSGMFGGEDYAREELVAEMGSAMLCMGAGIEGKALEEELENSASYLQSWLKAIKEAKDGGAKFINSSASKAQRACELLMPDVFGFKEEDKKEEE